MVAGNRIELCEACVRLAKFAKLVLRRIEE
jgi:hypothetical protein